MIKAAIFDMDGTIADSEKIIWRFTRAFFNEKGINLTPEEEKNYGDISLEHIKKWALKNRHNN